MLYFYNCPVQDNTKLTAGFFYAIVTLNCMLYVYTLTLLGSNSLIASMLLGVCRWLTTCYSAHTRETCYSAHTRHRATPPRAIGARSCKKWLLSACLEYTVMLCMWCLYNYSTQNVPLALLFYQTLGNCNNIIAHPRP